MITRLAVSGYRSLRDLRLSLGRLNVVTGANGSGKSSLYRALRLLADVAQGRVVQSLAEEGGIQSTLWAGPESFSRGMKSGEVPVQGTVRRNPVALKLGFAGDDYGYAIDLGLGPSASLFALDPDIKAEAMWTGEWLGRSNVFAERRGPGVRIRDGDGAWRQASTTLAWFDSMMTHCADPRDGLDLLLMRDRMRNWRFYDHLRTDRDAPARRQQVGTYTPVLASDGADLASAIITVRQTGDREGLAAAIDDAFPGATVDIDSRDGWFELEMRQHGLLRPLRTAELSDGTLRYLLLVAALMSPRPPELMVLNEPETSLHPDLLGPLARLIALAAERSQVVVVSHAAALVSALEDAGARRIGLEKSFGETTAGDDDPPKWEWPKR
ncbi:AAA family ATPase [Chelatococcus sambhunathii]|uniref:AAA family ATPase n=1 Tax=Chelatococcus sambhunathii TaxID=363953 RepID=A0ABU1DL38_9HYPH|nr:AAA family ATPase [Chelatococcus sambhunathii]MDR4308823.1 AAA family ATPase [Chelatococcus sambhunathii]